MIEINHLRKEYPGAIPLTDVNATINDGDVISIIGPSGTGKSTLIRCINLLENPTSGEIIINGKNILKGELKAVEVRKKVGMVFQDFNLYPHLSVIENIMVPQIKILKRTKQEAFNRARVLLKEVDLYDKMYDYPDDLSGGQKQRIAIARTLAMDTDVILFDEPTSALDPTMVDEVLYVIKKLAKTGKTIMIVTHEMRFAKEIANRVFFMCDGIIYEEGTPEQVFENPQKEKTIEFINRVSKKEILIENKDFDFTGAIKEITAFSEKNRIEYEKSNGMQHIFEELVTVLLIPKLKDNIHIKVVLVRADVSGATEMNIFYSLGYNPLEENISDKERLSVDIIKNKAKTIEIEDINEEGFTKKMKIVL